MTPNESSPLVSSRLDVHSEIRSAMTLPISTNGVNSSVGARDREVEALGPYFLPGCRGMIFQRGTWSERRALRNEFKKKGGAWWSAMLLGVAVAVVGSASVVGVLREAFEYMQEDDNGEGAEGMGVEMDDDEGKVMLQGIYDAYGEVVIERPWTCTFYLAIMAVLVGSTLGQVTAVRCIAGWTAIVCWAGILLL